MLPFHFFFWHSSTIICVRSSLYIIAILNEKNVQDLICVYLPLWFGAILSSTACWSSCAAIPGFFLNPQGPSRFRKAARQEAGLSSVQNFKFAGGHTKFGCSISAMDDWIAFIAGLPKSAADADAATVSSGETGRVCFAAEPSESVQCQHDDCLCGSGSRWRRFVDLQPERPGNSDSELRPIAAGRHSVVCNGTDFRGAKVAGGAFVQAWVKRICLGQEACFYEVGL